MYRRSLWEWDQFNFPGLFSWIIFLVLLDVVLKAFALWRSARNGQKWWFVFLLLINSLGIVPGIYLLTHPETKKSTTRKK